jgi:hypothetical protein
MSAAFLGLPISPPAAWGTLACAPAVGIIVSLLLAVGR